VNGNLRGYRCTEADGFGAGVDVGGRIERKRGIRIARTLRDALTERAGGEQPAANFGAGWPLRIFELSVAPADVRGEQPAEIRASAARVERELPLGDAFGPRAGEVAALLGEVGKIRWLRPDGSGASEARVAELVAAHYAGLADYAEVAQPSLRIVRTWHEARDLFRAMLPAYEGFLCRSAAVRAVSLVLADTTMEGAFRVAMPVVQRSAFLGVYDALWRAAGVSAASGVGALPLVNATLPEDQAHKVDVAVRAVETLSAALDAAYAPARRASWETALGIFTNTPDEIPDPLEHFADAVHAGRRAAEARRSRPLHAANCATCAELPAARDSLVMTFLEVTTQVADRMAAMGGRHFGWQVAYLLKDEKRLDPWRPLLDLWRLGACPVGSLGNVFVVFVPERAN